MHPSQVARSSGLKARLGSGLSFKPGDVSYFRTDPGQGWVLANAAQNVLGNMYPKFRIDARGLYTVTQPNLFADNNTNGYGVAMYSKVNPVDGLVYFNSSANNSGQLWKKASGLAEPVFVSNVVNPNNWWSNYRFVGFQNGIAVFCGYDGASSGWWNIFYSTNAGYTTWTQTAMSVSQSSQLWDVLWTGNRWIVAGLGLWVHTAINNAMPRATHLSGPVNINSANWGKLWKVGSTIYAQCAGGEYWAKSTDDGLSWTTYAPANCPYRLQAQSNTVFYSERYNIWIGVTSSNVMVYATDPTAGWTVLANAGTYNYGIYGLDMSDPGGILISAQTGLYFLYMNSAGAETIVYLGNYGFGGNQQQTEMYLDANNVLYWKGWSTRWYRCYSPIDRCSPPTLAAIGGRTPYMRVSP